MSAMPPRSIVQVSLSNELREQLAELKDTQGDSPEEIAGAACYVMCAAIYDFVDFIRVHGISSNKFECFSRHYSVIEQFNLQYYILYRQSGRQITVWDIVFSSPDSHPPSGGGPSRTKATISMSNTDVVGALDVVTVIDDLLDIAASAPPSDGLEFLHTFQGMNAMFVGSNPATILGRMAAVGATMRTPFLAALDHGAGVACEYSDAINTRNCLVGGRVNGAKELVMTSGMPIVLGPSVATDATICVPFFMTRDITGMVNSDANSTAQRWAAACEQLQITAEPEATAVPTVEVGKGQHHQVGLLANASRMHALATRALTDDPVAQATAVDVCVRLGTAIGAMTDETGALDKIQSGPATRKTALVGTRTATAKQVSNAEEKRIGRTQMPAIRVHFDVVTPLGC